MAATVQIVATPTADTAGSTLVLQTGQRHYMFGSIPQGLSRAMSGRVSRFTGMEHVFITGQTRWSNVGGIIGTMLTLTEAMDGHKATQTDTIRKKLTQKNANEEELRGRLQKVQSKPMIMFGAPNLPYLCATARGFIFRKGVPWNIFEIDREEIRQEGHPGIQPHFQDDHIRVWGMSILPSATSRKRSFEEAENGHVAKAPEYLISDDLSENEHRKLVVNGVVGEMFNSGWQLDNLTEVTLSEVIMPAAIFVRHPSTRKVQKYQGPLPGSLDPAYDPDLVVLVRKPWPGALIQTLPPTTPSDAAVSYIVRHTDRRGTFRPAKALALGLQAGPRWDELCKGETVKNDDGLLITPEQVIDAPKPGLGFAVLDIPNIAYIDDLLARPEWSETTITEGLSVIFWSGAVDALEDHRVKDFMAKWSNLKHVLLNEAYTGDYLVHDKAAVETSRLAQLDAARFRVPTHGEPTRQLISNLPNVVLGNRELLVRTEPSLQISTTAEEQQDQSVHPESLLKSVAALKAIETDREALEHWAENVPGRDAMIIPLGTGSAVPQKQRNVSSTLIRVPGWGSMLLDCGEGTIGQLERALTPEEFREVMQELRIIAISHLHADHHLGTVGVIKAWSESATVDGQLAVLASVGMHQFLHEYASVEDYGYSRIAPLVITPWRSNRPQTTMRTYQPKGSDRSGDNTQMTGASLGLKEFQAVKVVHCADALGFAFTWPDNFKVSYSGDCRPCPDLVKIGKDSTVCIHEGTFADSLHGEAVAKCHSTFGEAITIADAMNAKACILTHFSQRYGPGTGGNLNLLRGLATQKYCMRPVNGVQPLNRAETAHKNGINKVLIGSPSADFQAGRRYINNFQTDMQVCAALDMMRIKVGEIPQVRYFLPAILDMYWRDAAATQQAIVDAAKETLRTDLRKKSKRQQLVESIEERSAILARLKAKISKGGDDPSLSDISDEEDEPDQMDEPYEQLPSTV